MTKKRGLNIILLTVLFSMMGGTVFGQYYRNQGYWKKYRWQVIGGIGASNFLGELGGRDQVGSDFIWDLETRVFKPAFTLGVRYHVSKSIAVRTQFSYAVLAGDDELTKEKFRYNRHLHFRSNLFELAAAVEYTIYHIRPGHRYDLIGVQGQKPRAATFYLFAGIGGIKFNPQGKVEDSWYDLKPLGTEGQNFRNGPDPYSLYSAAIPLGIGYRWRPGNEHLFIGIEIGQRLTYTDYIDDVSTVYYDNEALGSQPGFSQSDNLLAQHFGDPSHGFYLGDDGNPIPLNSTATGEQRGDPSDNDSYLFVQATLSYALNKSPYKKVYRKAKRGKRIVF